MTPLKKLISDINNSDAKLVLTIAGAGIQAAKWLLDIPGASKTVLEIQIPYSDNSMSDVLGYMPEQFVSEKTALDMARKAYERSLILRTQNERVIGIACTAAITTDRDRRGDNHAYICLWTADSRHVEHLTLEKGDRDRKSEDQIISQAIINHISMGILNSTNLNVALQNGDTSEKKVQEYSNEIQALLSGQIGSFTKGPGNNCNPSARFTGVILPGSFNPLHEGHKSLLIKAQQLTGKIGVYEMSVKNVDKPDLKEKLVAKRLGQFGKSDVVLVTSTALFAQKSALFSGCTFVIGYDTAVRLLDPKYYDNNSKLMYRSMHQIMENNCDFLVAGRFNKNNFMGLPSINIPLAFSDMFAEIPESEFRIDVSSTDIRNRTG
jgi:nicotinamide mononucleotide (NMN) deamidase PncC